MSDREERSSRKKDNGSLSIHRSWRGSRSKHHRKRSYSASRSRSYRSRSRSRGHHRRRTKRRRRRHRRRSYSSSRSRSRTRSRHSSKKSVKRDRSKSSSASVNSEAGLTPAQIEEKRELERLTRDARSVFVSQLQVKVNERDIKKFFQRVCKVKDVQLLKDRFTRKSKGYGYVELASLDDIPLALELNDQKFIFPDGKEGFPVKVKPSEAEKNFTHSMEKKQNISTATYSAQHAESRRKAIIRKNPILRETWSDKIEIKNLHQNVRKPQILQICGEFGEVDDVDLIVDGRGISTGRCFVQFKDRDSVRRAIAKLDNLDFAGSKLKVYRMQKGQISRIKGTTLKDVNRLCGLPDESEALSGATFNLQTWRLEADSVDEGRYGGTGVAINSAQKMELMSKLGGGVGNALLREQQEKAASALPPPPPTEVKSNVIAGVASRCLIVQNMFDPEEETEQDWAKQIHEETLEEVENFGKVSHMFVDKESKGYIYICMQSIDAALDCAKALHGRFYNKRLISVEYLNIDKYKKKFSNENIV